MNIKSAKEGKEFHVPQDQPEFMIHGINTHLVLFLIFLS